MAFLGRPVIGGVAQGVLVRGTSVANPALLILHGGPGGAYIGCARAWFGYLEDRWTVVNWDMRGAGLSHSRTVDPRSLTASRLAADAGELIGWLRRSFGINRFVLMGHSFGTWVAPHVLRANPALFERYVAVSPAPTDPQAEKESYDWTLARARELGVSRAVRDLDRIGPPPYRSFHEGLGVRAKWTDELGGALEGTTGPDLAFRALRQGTEYTWGDLFVRFLPGVKFWMRNLDVSLTATATGEEPLALPLPVTVIQGSADWMAPAAATRRTFERMNVSRKRYVELDGVGHYPFVQSPERFAEALGSRPA